MATINKTIRDEIVAQSLSEISHARQYKEKRIRNWHKNENMYYGLKVKSEDSRANVELGKMPSFVHTVLSKIDNPLTFKFIKRKTADLKKAERANALRQIDSNTGYWDMKDLVGKKQAVIYGRAIYSYHAESQDGYKSMLENVDVYDFLIDPSAGGIDIEKAWYLGRTGVVKTKEDLREGVRQGIYLKNDTSNLINGSGNSDEITYEETKKRNREMAVGENFGDNKNLFNEDKYIFWEWFTTYKGKRYYLLLQETSGVAVRVEPIEEVFESELYPFWTWACFPDLTEFWTPSFCDYVREPFMAQSIVINQLIDNAEQINKPQKAVDVTAIENLQELKYRKDGIIRMRSTDNINNKIQMLQVPPLSTSLQVYETLETIQEKESGVTGSAKGVAEEERVAIYEGNQLATADRFGLLNKAYAHGYKRFATLYYEGIKEHLRSKKVAVEILGPDGVQVEEITAKDIIPKGRDFGIIVEATNAEMNISSIEKKNRMAFFNSQVNNQLVNPKKLFELTAQAIGLDEDTIKQLLDKEGFASMSLMSECDRDIESILDGKMPQVNMSANIAYMQRIVDYMKDNREHLDDEEFTMLSAYIEMIRPTVIRNITRAVTEQSLTMGLVPPTSSGRVNVNQVTPEPETVPNAAATSEELTPNLQ